MHPKLKGFPKCYVVNLEESVERRDYMNSEFDRLGLDGTVLQYKRLEDSNLKIVGDRDTLDILPLGATTSHLLTIKWWYENTDDEQAAFFEDDCDFSTIQHWNFVYEDYVKEFGVLWDGLQLCCMHEGWAVMYPRHRNGHDHGLQCYVIKRHYAKKIIDYYFINDNTIHFRMPYILKSEDSKKYKPTIENVVYGLGTFYIHPLFNHNVPKFPSTVHDPNSQHLKDVANHAYGYVKQWWETKGGTGNLNELFTYEWCCPPPQTFSQVMHIDR